MIGLLIGILGFGMVIGIHVLYKLSSKLFDDLYRLYTVIGSGYRSLSVLYYYRVLIMHILYCSIIRLEHCLRLQIVYQCDNVVFYICHTYF